MKTLESNESNRTKKGEAPENYAETEAAEQASLLPVRENLLSLDFEPNTKQELDEMVRELWIHKQQTTLYTYYFIGSLINTGRQKWTYGEKDMEKLAESLETNSSNLYKACKFAEQYSNDQIKELISGKFVMSWRNIALNQKIPPADLLEIYGKAESSGEFCNAVTKFKEEANSLKDEQGNNQSNDESQRRDDENTREQNGNDSKADEEIFVDAGICSSEGNKEEEPVLEEIQEEQVSIEEDGQQETDENDLESVEGIEDSEDDVESPETELNESRTQLIDSTEIKEVETLTAKSSILEKFILEKDKRIADLETENAALKKRIIELERQREVIEVDMDYIMDSESVDGILF